MNFRRDNGGSKKDLSLRLLHGEAASSSVETAGNTYQSPSIIAAGADAQGVALLSTITNLVLSFVLIRVPGIVENRRSLKRSTVILAVLGAVAWLPLIFVTLFFKGVSPLLLIGMWTVNLVPTVLLYPLRDNWLAGLVPAEKMGRYLSIRSVIAGCFYLATFYLMGYTLQATIGDKSFSFAFVMALAFLGSAVSLVLYCGVRPPAALASGKKAPALTFIGFLKNSRKTHLGTFILFVSMYTFAVNLAGPLFASYMLGDLRFSYMTYTWIVSCEYISRIFSLTIWGRKIDKLGSLRILSSVGYLIPFVPILWLFSGNLVYLTGVQVMAGVLWAAFDLSVQTFVYKATPPEQRLRYIVYYRGLTSFCVALGAITGAFLLNNMFRVFGSQILGLFLVSGALRMGIARIMLPRLTPSGIPDAAVHPELAAELANALAPERMGLYYYRESWRRLTRRAVSLGGSIIGRAVGKLAPARGGLLYQPQQWPEYLKRAGVQPALAATPPVRTGLYYHPGTWSTAPAQTQSATPPRVASRDGLFHNPQRWADYLKQSMTLNAMTMRTGGDGLGLVRAPVFHHPELWDKYRKSVAAGKPAGAGASRQGLLYHPDQWRRYEETTTRRSPARKPATVGVAAYAANRPVRVRPEGRYVGGTRVARAAGAV